MTATAFLTAADLDELAQARDSLQDHDIRHLVGALDAWADEQAVANVLMYPSALPIDIAVPALLRGLAEESAGYLRLAAAVGVGDLDPALLDDHRRGALVEALLDLIATDDGAAAARATISVAEMVRDADAAELVALLVHPVPLVRRNLEVVLLGLLGLAGLREVLTDREQVTDEEAADAAHAFDTDGIDRDRSVTDQRLVTMLSYIPSRSEWAGQAG